MGDSDFSATFYYFLIPFQYDDVNNDNEENVRQPNSSSRQITSINTNYRTITTKKRKQNEANDENRKRRRTNMIHGIFLSTKIIFISENYEVDNDLSHDPIDPLILNEQNTKGRLISSLFIFRCFILFWSRCS